jgi:hypothetical protein
LRGVARRIAERFSDRNEVHARMTELAGQLGARHDQDADRRRQRLAELRSQVDRAAKRYLEVEDECVAEACRKQMEALSADLKALEREESQAAPAAPALPSVDEQVDRAMQLHDRFQKAYAEMDRPMLRRLLLEFLSYIDMQFAAHKVVRRARSSFVRGTIYRRVEVPSAYNRTVGIDTEVKTVYVNLAGN